MDEYRHGSRSGRRAFLAAAGAGAVALAGCLGRDDAPREAGAGADADEPEETPAETNAPDDDVEGANGDEEDVESDLPVREASVPLAYDLDEFVENARSGGVGQDGIPSIDEPSIGDANRGDDLVDEGDPVFGVVVDGKARAYGRHVLVWHEIVNDELGGTNLAVTYCPLTGTPVGFERGGVEFGVSGRLVNNNLVMYDRATESWWPQVLGRAVDGPHAGDALREVRVTWTTWGRWRDAHPDTTVLTEETGYARDYDRDPYGSYNPRDGYYADGGPMFPVMNEDDRHPDKRVFVGARGPDGALAVEKAALREDRLVELDVGDTPHLVAHDPSLDTGYAYRNPDGEGFEVRGEGDDLQYVDETGEGRTAADLPLESVNASDGMWFVWAAFYPDLAIHS